MITEPTVLILGAGANQPFGFPLGHELKQEIVELPNSSDNQIITLLKGCSLELTEVFGFAKALSLSPFFSVDRFLEFSPSYRHVGCAAITASLLLKSQNLIKQRDYDWIAVLFNAMFPQFDEMGNGLLTIITYNYDCSFEYLLHQGLFSSIDKARAEVLYPKIKIIHLHGRIAPSTKEWVLPSALPDVIMDSIDNNKGIKIIHESNPDEKQFAEAHIAIRKAKRICFLGFGYDEVNLGRIFKGTDPIPLEEKLLLGSAFGRTEMENWNVNVDFFNSNLRFGGKNWQNKEFLLESCVLKNACFLQTQKRPH